MVELPVSYYVAPWGELPAYSGLCSRRVWLWDPKEGRWRSGYRRGKSYAVLRTVLSRPSAVQRRVQEAVKALSSDARGVLILWVSRTSVDDMLHWGLALDTRTRGDTSWVLGDPTAEPVAPPKVLGEGPLKWPVPDSLFPTKVRFRGAAP